jgi:methionyl-tRNA synthetase
MITIDDFAKVEITIGKILAVEKVPETDKLLKLSVSFGGEPAETRTIVSGIAAYYPDITVLVGVKCGFVTNLEPRMLRGIESQGMILFAGTSVLRVPEDIPEGTRVK